MLDPKCNAYSGCWHLLASDLGTSEMSLPQELQIAQPGPCLYSVPQTRGYLHAWSHGVWGAPVMAQAGCALDASLLFRPAPEATCQVLGASSYMSYGQYSG